jgi:chitosanase
MKLVAFMVVVVVAVAVGGVIRPGASPRDLTDPQKKEIAQKLVSSAENSTLDWRSQYGYIEDIGDGRGYTAGIIGFCTGTGDVYQLVQSYTRANPNNALAKYLPALKQLTDRFEQTGENQPSHSGLDPNFRHDWKLAAKDPVFRQTQDALRDQMYFAPAVTQARLDHLSTLGQFIYYDAYVKHGPGKDPHSFGGIRTAAMSQARPPSQGGDEAKYLTAFLMARKAVLLAEDPKQSTSRIDDMQLAFVKQKNWNLDPPLRWTTYDDRYEILTR